MKKLPEEQGLFDYDFEALEEKRREALAALGRLRAMGVPPDYPVALGPEGVMAEGTLSAPLAQGKTDLDTHVVVGVFLLASPPHQQRAVRLPLGEAEALLERGSFFLQGERIPPPEPWKPNPTPDGRFYMFGHPPLEVFANLPLKEGKRGMALFATPSGLLAASPTVGLLHRETMVFRPIVPLGGASAYPIPLSLASLFHTGESLVGEYSGTYGGLIFRFEAPEGLAYGLMPYGRTTPQDLARGAERMVDRVRRALEAAPEGVYRGLPSLWKGLGRRKAARLAEWTLRYDAQEEKLWGGEGCPVSFPRGSLRAEGKAEGFAVNAADWTLLLRTLAHLGIREVRFRKAEGLLAAESGPWVAFTLTR